MKLKEKSSTYRSLHPTMQHICLILSWLVEVTLGSGVNKTKTDRVPSVKCEAQPGIPASSGFR